jgi:hypothetical protein
LLHWQQRPPLDRTLINTGLQAGDSPETYASRFNGLASLVLAFADGHLGFIEYSGSCCRNEKAVENGFSAPCAVYAPA